MGPFATTVVGELADIVATVADLLADGSLLGRLRSSSSASRHAMSASSDEFLRALRPGD